MIANGGWTVVAAGGQTYVDNAWSWTGGSHYQTGGVGLYMYSFKNEINLSLASSFSTAKYSLKVANYSVTGIDFSFKIMKVKRAGVTAMEEGICVRNVQMYSIG